MNIVETYSHLNGLEFLIVHKPKLWGEIKKVIALVDAETCKTKVSKEKTMKGKLLYSPIDMNKAFSKLLRTNEWQESRVSYWVTKNEKLIRKTLTMPATEQKKRNRGSRRNSNLQL
ncbi:MAG: BglII/BstYI family type II restriction endonuclease [Spirochaetota bacterium]